MFKSVIERQRAGRLGLGLWWSVAVHAGLFGAVLVISARPAELPPEPEKDPILTLYQGRQVAKGYTAPTQPKQAVQPKRTKPKRTTMPTQINPLPADPQPVEPEPAANPSDTDEVVPPGDGVPGGHPDGDPTSNITGVAVIPGLPNGVGDGTGEEVLPFGQGMTQPVLMGGPPLEYTEQARMARVEGTVIAKCVVTREGDVRDCRIIKGLAHMDEEVLDALHHRRYSPVTFQGRPQSVSYVFTLRFKLPR
ncbi:TonB family protein [Myxococcus sp. CA056]|uniref:TonB family protein n=1 Tax=Myxococcus sp. CA056 TaxID=2741740 RepID=UPI00157AD866|nr:TonB family protein [Myxococcus sp. CA056]